MINQHDLHDMTSAFISIRNDIKSNVNRNVLAMIIHVLEDENNSEDNQIRKAISSIKELDREQWYYVFHNNVYVDSRSMKNRNIYDVLVKLCKELDNLLKTDKYETAYDLVDCCHCLPDIIADHHFTIPKAYWRTYVKPYRNKWDKTFLRKEQNNFRV